MSSPRPGRVLLMATLLQVACGPELEVVEGEYVDYMYDPAFEPCAGNVAHIDASVEWFAEYHDLDPVDLPRFTYEWLQGEDFEASYEGDASKIGGFARPRDSAVFSRTPVHIHEIAHVVRFELYPARASQLLVEGHAVALAGDGYYPSSAPSLTQDLLLEPLDPRPYIDEPLPADLSFYAAAGSFVTYLLGTYGPDSFADLMRGVPASPSGEEFRRAFSRVYGEGLDEVVEEFLGASECPEDAIDPPLPPICGAPRIEPMGGSTWIYAQALECSSEDAVGSRDDAQLHHVTLDLPSDGVYEVVGFGDPRVVSALAPCGPCPWLREVVRSRGAERHRVELSAGRYVLSLAAPGDGVTLGGVGVSLLSSSEP